MLYDNWNYYFHHIISCFIYSFVVFKCCWKTTFQHSHLFPYPLQTLHHLLQIFFSPPKSPSMSLISPRTSPLSYNYLYDSSLFTLSCLPFRVPLPLSSASGCYLNPFTYLARLVLPLLSPALSGSSVVLLLRQRQYDIDLPPPPSKPLLIERQQWSDQDQVDRPQSLCNSRGHSSAFTAICCCHCKHVYEWRRQKESNNAAVLSLLFSVLCMCVPAWMCSHAWRVCVLFCTWEKGKSPVREGRRCCWSH